MSIDETRLTQIKCALNLLCGMTDKHDAIRLSETDLPELCVVEVVNGDKVITGEVVISAKIIAAVTTYRRVMDDGLVTTDDAIHVKLATIGKPPAC